MRSNQVVYSASYSPYGVPFEQRGIPDPTALGFTGQQTDASGLQYLRARYYNPTHASFLTRDPVMGVVGGRSASWNPYPYVQGNPINYVDPSGEFGILIAAVAGLFVGMFAPSAINSVVDHDIQFLHDAAWAGDAIINHWNYTYGNESLDYTAYGNLQNFGHFLTEGGGAGILFDPFDYYFTASAWSQGDFHVLDLLGLLPLIPSVRHMGGRLLGGVDDTVPAGRRATTATNTMGFCPAANSFSADTTVQTTEGDVPISEIEVGDTVLAYNEATGEVGEYTVTATINHTDEVIIHLTIDGELIETTPEHPFYTTAGEWVEAEDLQPGDQIYALDNTYGTVESIVVIEDAHQRMYNLTVDTAHTFFVGAGDWLVHNQDISTFCNISFPEPTDDYVGFVVHAHSNKPGFTDNLLLSFEIGASSRRLHPYIQIMKDGVNITGYNLPGWQIWHGVWNHPSVKPRIDKDVDIIAALWERSGLESNLDAYLLNLQTMPQYEAAFNTHTGRYAYDVGFTGLTRVNYPTGNPDFKVVADFVRPNYPSVQYVQPYQPIIPKLR